MVSSMASHTTSLRARHDFVYLLFFDILNFCIRVRLKFIRLFNGRGLVLSIKFAFVGVMADNGGRKGLSDV